MVSEQNKYYLMHKNDMVAALTLDKFGNILAFESLDKTLLPPGHIKEKLPEKAPDIIPEDHDDI